MRRKQKYAELRRLNIFSKENAIQSEFPPMNPTRHDKFMNEKQKGKGGKDRRGGRAAVTANDQ